MKKLIAKSIKYLYLVITRPKEEDLDFLSLDFLYKTNKYIDKTNKYIDDLVNEINDINKKIQQLENENKKLKKEIQIKTIIEKLKIEN